MAFKMKGFSGFKSSPTKFGVASGAIQAASQIGEMNTGRSRRREPPKKTWGGFFERFIRRRRRKQERPQEGPWQDY